VPIGIFYIVNYIRNRQISKVKGGVERMAHFDSKTQTQPFNSSENSARHNRAMKSHLSVVYLSELGNRTSIPRSHRRSKAQKTAFGTLG